MPPITNLKLIELPGTPAGNPPAGQELLFITDGILYKRDSTGNDEMLSRRVIYATNTDTTTNLNAGTADTFPNDVPIFGTVNDRSSGDFTVDSETQLTANFTGRIKVSVNIFLGVAATRPSVNMQLSINGTNSGPIGATGYIRNNNGHFRSSLHISEAEYDVNDGETIILTSGREANAATVPMIGVGQSSIRIERIS